MPRLSTPARRFVALTAVLLGSAAPLRAAEFEFVGPAPTRNFQPIQLIFLNLPFESAATLERGGLALLLQSAEISEIATSEGTIDSTLKFETNRTVLGARYGLFERWEAGIELPFISRYGGFIDPMIDWVEEVFGRVNPERKLFPENSFGGFVVVRGDTVLFEAGEETFQPGDLVFSIKHELQPPPAWPRLALRGAIKAPTGDAGAVLGSGKPDFGAGVAADYRAFESADALLQPRSRLSRRPDHRRRPDAQSRSSPSRSPRTSPSPGAGRRCCIRRRTRARSTAPHSSLLDGTVVELGFGLNFAYNPWFGAQLLGIQNMSGVEQSADFTLLLSLVYRPWAHPTDLPPIGAGPPVPLPPLGAPLPQANRTSAPTPTPTPAP